MGDEVNKLKSYVFTVAFRAPPEIGHAALMEAYAAAVAALRANFDAAAENGYEPWMFSHMECVIQEDECPE